VAGHVEIFVTEPNNTITLGSGYFLRRVSTAWALREPCPEPTVGLEYASASVRDHFSVPAAKPLLISAHRKVGKSRCIAAAAEFLKASVHVYAPAGRDEIALARSAVAGPDPNAPAADGPILIVIIGVDGLLGQRAHLQGFWEMLEEANPGECRAFFGLPPGATPHFILCAGPQPPPLNRERIGVLNLIGYTTDEKQQILSGLADATGFKMTRGQQDELLRAYSRSEPGLQTIVRLLELARAEAPTELTMGFARRHLGSPPPALFDQYRKLTPGVCLSAAYTPAGGTELIVECARSALPGLLVVGSAGPVMVESVQIALTAVNTMLPSSQRLCTPGTGGVVVNFQGCANWKKEGPSAGLPIALSLMSLASGRALPENFAATGEVSLTGRVHGVSKVPNKVLVWERNGVTRSLLPHANRGDLDVLSALSATHQADFVGTLAEAFSACGLSADVHQEQPGSEP
jgi:hypothetical protein